VRCHRYLRSPSASSTPSTTLCIATSTLARRPVLKAVVGLYPYLDLPTAYGRDNTITSLGSAISCAPSTDCACNLQAAPGSKFLAEHHPPASRLVSSPPLLFLRLYSLVPLLTYRLELHLPPGYSSS
jgi:hypothetical protein